MSSPFEPTWYVTVTALRNNVLTGEARRGSSWNCASAYTSVHSEVRVLHLSVRRARLRYVSNRPDPPPSLCSSAPPPSRSSSPFPKVERLSHKFSGAAAFFVSLPPAAAGLAYRTNARPANESRRDGGNGNGRRRRRTTSLDGIGGRGEDASILCSAAAPKLNRNLYAFVDRQYSAPKLKPRLIPRKQGRLPSSPPSFLLLQATSKSKIASTLYNLFTLQERQLETSEP